eukprot:5692983-Prymnesium_polylepis.1
MPIRRLTRTPALPAGSLSGRASRAVFRRMVARCEWEHISLSAVRQTEGILSVQLIDVTPILTCVRT